ncbi:uncharacterized protein LOC105694981 [Orussus abietinus]|uniref:uncharacterized protein LOC105694981 n=1 Tax=Orussus abietinus TaxID=222816 RepID=UPI000625EFF6|nr:uncharacterized protein LOC105694981 [Orussus abietinus]
MPRADVDVSKMLKSLLSVSWAMCLLGRMGATSMDPGSIRRSQREFPGKLAPGNANLEEKSIPLPRLYEGERPSGLPGATNLGEMPQLRELPGTRNLAEKAIPEWITLKRSREISSIPRSEVEVLSFPLEPTKDFQDFRTAKGLSSKDLGGLFGDSRKGPLPDLSNQP